MKTFYTVSNNGEVIDTGYSREEAKKVAEDYARSHPGEAFVISKSIMVYITPPQVDPICYFTEDN